MYKLASVVVFLAAVLAAAEAGVVGGSYPCQPTIGTTTYDLTPLAYVHQSQWL
jgi:hypothetical protein